VRGLEHGIDTATSEDRARFGILSVLAEFQRELIIANIRDGLAAARARGRIGGRRTKLTAEHGTHARELHEGRKHTVQQIADLLRIPRTTAYGYLNPETAAQRTFSSDYYSDP